METVYLIGLILWVFVALMNDGEEVAEEQAKEERQREAEKREARRIRDAEEAAREAERRRREVERETRERQRIERLSRTLRGLKSLSPEEFEFAVARIFEKQGYEIRVTQQSVDDGVDIFLTKENSQAVVQCKRFDKPPVGVKIVRELLGVMTKYKIKRGFVVTTAAFTRQAKDFSKGTGVRLWDGEKLAEIAAGIRKQTVAASAA